MVKKMKTIFVDFDAKRQEAEERARTKFAVFQKEKNAWELTVCGRGVVYS